MTTAARPTFNPAKGGYTGRDLGFKTGVVASKELPGYLTIKRRKKGQNCPEELETQDLKSLLEKAEQDYRLKKGLLLPAPEEQDEDVEFESQDSEEENSDDETAALMMELEKIKRERALEKEEVHEVITVNPLLQDFTVKRKWDEDIVFRNQARPETKREKRFINDTLRSDFHRKFLDRYVH